MTDKEEVIKKLDKINEDRDRIRETVKRGGKIPQEAVEDIKKASESLETAADEVERINGSPE